MKTITANRLVLVDGNKKPRIVLDASWPGGFASVDLFGTSGAAWKLWIDKDGVPKMAIQREDSRFALTIALDEHGEVIISLYDDKGRHMIRLGRWWNGAGIPSIDIFKKGVLQWSTRGLAKKRKKRRALRKP